MIYGLSGIPVWLGSSSLPGSPTGDQDRDSTCLLHKAFPPGPHSGFWPEVSACPSGMWWSFHTSPGTWLLPLFEILSTSILHTRWDLAYLDIITISEDTTSVLPTQQELHILPQFHPVGAWELCTLSERTKLSRPVTVLRNPEDRRASKTVGRQSALSTSTSLTSQRIK